jgi:hypothetical protein
VGNNYDGGISLNRALILTPAATVALVWFYHRQTELIPVILPEGNGPVGTLFLANKAPFV